jgi:hypothetical protein
MGSLSDEDTADGRGCADSEEGVYNASTIPGQGSAESQ